MSGDLENNIVTCTECNAKLRLKNSPTPGKKIICPKCNSSFTIPEPGEVVEELELETEEEQEPVRTKSKGKKRSKSGGNLPFLIGVGFGTFLLVTGLGFGAWKLWPVLFGSKHETALQNVIKSMNDLGAILESVQDDSSARDAAPKITSTGGRLKTEFDQLKALPKPSKSEDERLKAKYETKLNEAKSRMMKASMAAGFKGAREPSFRDAINQMRSISNRGF